MGNNGHGLIDWGRTGPRVLDWFRAELPRRRTMNGVYDDAHAALALAGTADGLRVWVNRRPEWPAIKQLLPTGPVALMGATASASSPVSGGPSRCTFEEFKLDKQRADCPVCHLPAELRAILKRVSDKGSGKLAEQVEYVRKAWGLVVTGAQLTGHRSGGHET